MRPWSDRYRVATRGAERHRGTRARRRPSSVAIETASPCGRHRRHEGPDPRPPRSRPRTVPSLTSHVCDRDPWTISSCRSHLAYPTLGAHDPELDGSESPPEGYAVTGTAGSVDMRGRRAPRPCAPAWMRIWAGVHDGIVSR
jgi:hypothetical protein